MRKAWNRKLGFFTAGVALTGLIGGCSLPSDHKLNITRSPSTTNLDRSMGLDVENFGGSVVIEVVPGLSKPEVRASVRDESNGFMRVLDDKMVKGWFSADLVNQNGRPTLRVLTSRSTASKPPASVVLKLRVPAADGVRVRNSGGYVELRGVWGEIIVENGYRGGEGGDILLSTDRRLTDAVRLTTTAGNVELRTGMTSKGRFELNSSDGRMEINVRGDVLTSQRRTASSFVGVLNGGENPIVLTSATGKLKVDVGGANVASGPESLDGL